MEKEIKQLADQIRQIHKDFRLFEKEIGGQRGIVVYSKVRKRYSRTKIAHITVTNTTISVHRIGGAVMDYDRIISAVMRTNPKIYVARIEQEA